MRLSPQEWTKVDRRAVKLREGKKGKKRKNSLGFETLHWIPSFIANIHKI